MACLRVAGGASASQITAAAAPPAALTDREFWSLSTESSEQDGFFRSDNLLSNETSFQYVIPDLLKTVKPGRIYLGVGPEQNFTYISALRPAMAFIIDIRHGNLDVQLLYKALFELSKDRADFVSRLFSRTRPERLTAASTGCRHLQRVPDRGGEQGALRGKPAGDRRPAHEETRIPALARRSRRHSLGVQQLLPVRPGHQLRLEPFCRRALRRSSARPAAAAAASGATYADLMIADDGHGQNRSFLANEENFAYVKDLETRNLIVPIVGDFGGQTAIRAVAGYLKRFDARVAAFYLSNVEQFLTQENKWDTFCAERVDAPA